MEIVKSYCYLGVDFVCSGTDKTARTNTAEKAHKAIFPLLSVITQFKINSDKSINLFQSMIRPIVLYNSENPAQLTHHLIQAVAQNKKLNC